MENEIFQKISNKEIITNDEALKILQNASNVEIMKENSVSILNYLTAILDDEVTVEEDVPNYLVC